MPGLLTRLTRRDAVSVAVSVTAGLPGQGGNGVGVGAVERVPAVPQVSGELEPRGDLLFPAGRGVALVVITLVAIGRLALVRALGAGLLMMLLARVRLLGLVS